METYFQKSIIEKGLVPAGIDARHVEGFIRVQYSTLNHLDWPTIKREVRIALGCIKFDPELAERNARGFGL
jgi:hypothetical protein